AVAGLPAGAGAGLPAATAAAARRRGWRARSSVGPRRRTVEDRGQNRENRGQKTEDRQKGWASPHGLAQPFLYFLFSVLCPLSSDISPLADAAPNRDNRNGTGRGGVAVIRSRLEPRTSQQCGAGLPSSPHSDWPRVKSANWN